MLPKKRSAKSLIRKNMGQILRWVDEGFTLKSIYDHLREEGVIKCGYSNFNLYYYQFKNSDETFATGREPSDNIESIEQVSQPAEVTAEEKEEAAPLPVSTEQPRSQPIKRIEVDSQADRERRRKIAKAIFASYRNEQ